MMFKNLLLITLTIVTIPNALALKTIEQVQGDFIEGVLTEVLIKDSSTANQQLEHLKAQLNAFKQHANNDSLSDIQNKFKQLIITWKAVEAVYIAGAIDEDYLDHPRFIDFFHQGNESITKLVERAINSNNALNKALFKYSTKSINALEYLLFAHADNDLISLMQQRDYRRVNAALLVINNMQQWLEEIEDFYRNDKKLSKNPAQSLGLIVNKLIDSSYKLLNWRVGEAGGLAKKHFGKPSATHLEYTLSESSLLAVKSILTTHRKIIDREGNSDLLAIAEVKEVTSELIFIRKTIDETITLIDTLPTPIAKHLESDAYKNLHKKLDQLFNAYYFLLIDALGLSANIIDADGD